MTSKILKRASLACAALIFAAPAPRAQSGVTAVLPNGREIHPAGNWIPLAPYPFALAVRPDGDQIAVPSIGFPFALNVIANHPAPAPPCCACRRERTTILPSRSMRDWPTRPTARCSMSPPATRARFAPTGPATGSPRARSRSTAQSRARNQAGSFAATLILSADGKTLYALDQGNWRIVILDAATLTRIAEIPTGSYPFGLALSPDGARLYVTNTGLFEYTTVPGVSEKNKLGTGLHLPPFGYPSKAAREGAVAEGKQIPGLGDENSARGSSLWTYDVRDRAHPAVTAKLRLGAQITEAPGETVGGAAPSGVAADDDAVYVSLAHEDAVAKVSADGTRTSGADRAFTLSPGRVSRTLAAGPCAASCPAAWRCATGGSTWPKSGIDAVGVLDAATMQRHRTHSRGLEPLGRRPLARRQDTLRCEYQGQGRGAQWRQANTTPTRPPTSARWNWAA